MISQTAEYALRAMVCLAADPGVPRTARDIAEETQVPAGYLAKVLQGLARAGLIHSQRGPHGGFTLRRPPAELSIYEIVQAVDPLQRIRRCPLNLPGHADHLCPLHRRLDEAIELVEQTFRQSTVAELLSDGTGSAPLCAATG